MESHVIGISPARKDAWGKVSGEALYVNDVKLPVCLEGKVLRSPYPHARIAGIDVGKAMKLPGVAAVITGQDLPAKRFGNSIADQPVLARRRVRFVGERVAAVAAVDADTAAEALELIKVEYEELPVLTDPVLAMESGAPLLHPKFSTYRNAPALDIPNVAGSASYGTGDVEAAFAQAELVFEHTFRTQVVHQGYLEPHACMVQSASGDSATIWSNNKSPFELRAELARLLGLPASGIEVIYPFIGGDFGGKGAVMDEPVCYYLALASGSPVRMTMSVREELLAANPRHAAIITLKSGLRKDGTLLARQARVVFDSGAYAGANSHPLVAGVRRVLGAYRIPHTRIDGFSVYTNSVPAGHCRAPGDPQVFFAVESHTDILAQAVCLDPVEFRRRNVLLEGHISPLGLEWSGINALQVLETAVMNSGWNQPKASRFAGRGMALTERNTGLGGSSALVTLQSDGSATVVSGATDPGTGSHTVLRQIAAHELGLPLEKVSFSGGNTGMAPFDNGSGSSRVTHVTGQAVRLAAQDAVSQGKDLAAAQLQVSTTEIIYQDGIFSSSAGKSLCLQEVLARSGRAGKVITGRGSYVADKAGSTCFSAQIAEVEVDPETGQVTVQRVITANDIGLAVNPETVKGQVEGTVVQGMGFALNEELPRPEGLPQVTSLADYKLATCLDAPTVQTFLVEGSSGPGPYGAKSIGEQGIAAVAPAIANAVYDAVGVRLFELPLTAEKIRHALQQREGAGG